MGRRKGKDKTTTDTTGCVYDAQLKLLLQNKVYVANICNVAIYGGKPIVRADMLEPWPVEQNAVIDKGDGSFVTDNRFRDLAFFVRSGTGEEGFLLCLEIQTRQDLAMPLRILEYNARDYACFRRAPEFNASHKVPMVVSLLLNFSDGPWEAPSSIVEMAEFMDAGLKGVLEPGRMLVVDPYTMDENKLSMFCTELKFMLCCFRLSRNGDALLNFLKANEALHLPPDMIGFLYLFFNIKWNNAVDGTAGGVKDMCEAIRQLQAKSYSLGIEQGIEQGIEKGIEQGIEQGIEKGIEKDKHDVVVNALTMKMGYDVIKKLTGLSKEQIADIAQSIAHTQA